MLGSRTPEISTYSVVIVDDNDPNAICYYKGYLLYLKLVYIILISLILL